MTERKGAFITFEGCDGAGKSTQVRMLCEALERAGETVVQTREVGGTEAAEEIRNMLFQRDAHDWDPVSEVMMVSAARRDHLVHKIWPAMDEGKVVVSDRFADSTLVYQGYARKVDVNVINEAYKIISDGFQPDITFILDLPVEEGLDRSMKHMDGAQGTLEATEDKYELFGIPFHQKVRDGFQEVAKQNPGRCVVIDSRQSIDEIHNEIIGIVQERLGLSLRELDRSAV